MKVLSKLQRKSKRITKAAADEAQADEETINFRPENEAI